MSVRNSYNKTLQYCSGDLSMLSLFIVSIQGWLQASVYTFGCVVVSAAYMSLFVLLMINWDGISETTTESKERESGVLSPGLMELPVYQSMSVSSLTRAENGP